MNQFPFEVLGRWHTPVILSNLEQDPDQRKIKRDTAQGSAPGFSPQCIILEKGLERALGRKRTGRNRSLPSEPTSHTMLSDEFCELLLQQLSREPQTPRLAHSMNFRLEKVL